MSKDDPALPTDEQLEKYAAWREEVADRLNDAQRWSESVNFRECGKLWGNFQVLACEGDPGHQARALPFTCHLRYCPECERRHQARQVEKYTAILKDVAEDGGRDGWTLKKITLTTPYRLDATNAEQLYTEAWEHFEAWQQLIMQELDGDQMTKGEVRRGRYDYTPHGYGALVSAEFGGDTRHLHFHLTVYAPFMPKAKITNLWLQATGGICQVTWVSQVDYHDVEDSIREQVKYVTKFAELSPELVIKLADVLDGQHRMRVYGVFRGAKNAEAAPCTCDACGGKLTIMRARGYFEYVLAHNIEPDAAIAAAGSSILLDLKRGNFSGEAGGKLARSDPDELIEQVEMPGFDAVFTKKTPFVYQ